MDVGAVRRRTVRGLVAASLTASLLSGGLPAVAAAGAPVALASSRADGVKGNGPSADASLSADGTRVAFTSRADNLDGRDTDRRPDVYVKDLSSGAVALASVDGDGKKAQAASSEPALSPDGTAVAFVTAAPLQARDGNGRADVYVRNLVTGAVVLASAGADGTPVGGASPDLSADGSRVAFLSGGSVRVKDLRSGALTTLDALADEPSLSDDGMRVVAAGRYGGDQALPSPVFADLRRGTSRRLPRDRYVVGPVISGDGTTAGYTTSSDPYDAGPCRVNLVTDALRCVAPADPPQGTYALSNFAGVTDLSADGRRVAVSQHLTLESDDGSDYGPFYRRVYVQDAVTGAVLWASPRNPLRDADGDASFPSLDATGTVVAFESTATTLFPGDRDRGSDVYVVRIAGGGDPRSCTITGTSGDDRLRGTPGPDVICAGAGDDRIFAGGGDDVVHAGPGDDRLWGGPGDDILDGGPGADWLFGGPGDDVLEGGPDGDVCNGGPGSNRWSGCERVAGTAPWPSDGGSGVLPGMPHGAHGVNRAHQRR